MSTLTHTTKMARRVADNFTQQGAVLQRLIRPTAMTVLAFGLVFGAMLGQSAPASAWSGYWQDNAGGISPQRMVGWGVWVGSGYTPSISGERGTTVTRSSGSSGEQRVTIEYWVIRPTPDGTAWDYIHPYASQVKSTIIPRGTNASVVPAPNMDANPGYNRVTARATWFRTDSGARLGSTEIYFTGPYDYACAANNGVRCTTGTGWIRVGY